MASLADLLFDDDDDRAARCLVGADGLVGRVNRAWERYSRLPRAQSAGRPLQEALGAHHPVVSAIRNGQGSFTSGDAQWTGVIHRVDGGAVLIIAREVTPDLDEAAAERETLSSQRQLALDAARMGWWHYDPISRIATYDERYKQIFGVDGSERPNEEILELLHPEDRPRVWAAVERALVPHDPAPYNVEYRVIRPDGDVRWVEAHGVAAFDGEREERRAVGFAGTVTDITARKRAEEELRQSTSLLRAISDSSEDAIFAKDRRGRIRFANPATIALIGKPLEAVVGRTDGELLEDAAAARAVMETDRRIMESGIAEEVEENVPLPDGRMRVWLSRKTPWRDSAGRVVGLLGISRDITERKRDLEALRESDQRKSEFLAVLSHELRNPLAAIRSSMYVLQSPAANAASKAKVTAVVQRQTEQLARLVDDLLDISRISRGKVELRRARLDVCALARNVVSDLGAAFEHRSIAVRLEAPAAPLWVDADATRIAQVLGNILHNAATFTPAGGAVTVTASSEDGNAVVKVRDSGVGIDGSELERLFEPFAQAHQNLARPTGGLGLGLSLARRFTELHGGTIEARSQGLGNGSEFVIRLPLAPAAAEAGTQPGPNDDPRAVLIIEDNLDAADSLAEALASLGHDVRVAHDGATGIALARDWKPDVILCDIGLPDIDGYEVARRLRATKGVLPLRLVALTGYAQPEDVARAHSAGFDAHVAKPPLIDALSGLLRP